MAKNDIVLTNWYQVAFENLCRSITFNGKLNNRDNTFFSLRVNTEKVQMMDTKAKDVEDYIQEEIDNLDTNTRKVLSDLVKVPIIKEIMIPLMS